MFSDQAHVIGSLRGSGRVKIHWEETPSCMHPPAATSMAVPAGRRLSNMAAAPWHRDDQKHTAAAASAQAAKALLKGSHQD